MNFSFIFFFCLPLNLNRPENLKSSFEHMLFKEAFGQYEKSCCMNESEWYFFLVQLNNVEASLYLFKVLIFKYKWELK